MSSWTYLDAHPPSPLVEARLPATAERFKEARYFAALLRDFPVVPERAAEAQWLLSAHIAAFVGIVDAADADFARAGRSKAEFQASSLGRDDRLTSDAEDPILRDPLAANRAYRDLRNLRVHFAMPLIELQRCGFCLRDSWCIRPLDEALLRQLRAPQFPLAMLPSFNQYLRHRGCDHVTSQFLVVRLGAIEDTARELERIH